MNCSTNYGKDCFNCKEILSNFSIVSTGAGMDTKMLQDFGERKIAIDCPSKEGYLVLNLTKEQINHISGGKLEEVSEEAANKGLFNARIIKSYLIVNKDKVDVQVVQPCMVPPNYP